jgi:hypothetical protein
LPGKLYDKTNPGLLTPMIPDPEAQAESRIGDMKWLISQTGWTHDKISRLARIGRIKGAFQAQPRTHGSMWCFRKAKTLAWLDSLETK